MGRLSSGRLRGKQSESGFNPMEGAANLADVMLVLACGLMLSLIVSWNVDIGQSAGLQELDQGREVKELEGLVENPAADLADGTGYEEMGTVYRDPATGKLYMMTHDGTGKSTDN